MAYFAGIRGLLCRARPLFAGPYTVPKATVLGFAVGLLTPVLHVVFLLISPWDIPRWLCLIPAPALLIVLYWKMDWSGIRLDSPSSLQSFVAALLFANGFLGSVLCYRNHVCMGGHRQHPPYPEWHYWADIGWVGSLMAATVWLCSVRSPLAVACSMFTGFILCYRFVFGSFGGMFLFPI